jgi:hypothetical protein
MALGSTQPLTEMSTRNLAGVKGLPARKTDNLTSICEPISRKCVNLDISQSYGPPLFVTGIALSLFTVSRTEKRDANKFHRFTSWFLDTEISNNIHKIIYLSLPQEVISVWLRILESGITRTVCLCRVVTVGAHSTLNFVSMFIVPARLTPNMQHCGH